MVKVTLRSIEPLRILFEPVRVFAVTAVLVAAACSSAGTTGVDPDPSFEVEERDGVVFMTQNVVPEAMMDALYMGRVFLAEDGCLRLETAETASPVWPQGYDFSVSDGRIRVLDRDGEVVGTVGEEFHLPGGLVPELSDAMGFDQADRDLAESRCPGDYWIVGEDE